MRILDIPEIDDICVGASLLGSGGGGDPYIGKLMAIDAIRKYGPVSLISPDELNDDDLIVPIGMMGAPTVLAEKGIGSHDIDDLYDMVTKLFPGRKIGAFLCNEAGGVNSLMPVAAAAKMQIPLIDGDGMGRAFPELQMETMAIGGITAKPVALVDEKGNRAILETIDNKWTEELARAFTVKCGGNVSICMYMMDGKTSKKYTVPGTISLCSRIGQIIREAKNASDMTPDEYFLKHVGAFELFRGKIIDVDRQVNGAFNRGSALLEGMGDYKGRRASVIFQNENLMAKCDDRILATTPDLICLVDCSTFTPITTDKLKYGKRVLMISLPCHPLWRTKKGLELVGPGYFRLDCDYIPVEQRIRPADKEVRS